MSDFEYDREGYVAEVEKSIGFIGQDLEFFTQAKADQLVSIATRDGGASDHMSVLDVGCGVGLLDERIVERFGAVAGVDSSLVELKEAKRRLPAVMYAASDGTRLPFKDESFDAVVASCVLHHVPAEMWHTFAFEMARVAKPGGAVVVIEHNPINPLTRLAVSRCEFDDDAVLLRRKKVGAIMRSVGLEVAEARYILFFPWRGQAFRRVESMLRGLPLGAQHLSVGLKSR